VTVFPAAFADPLIGEENATSSGLPLPRFVSLKASEANARTGPSTKYPIKWVYVRKNMPVEVIAEFGVWRKIRDIDGQDGWLHESLLSGKRTAMIKESVQPLYHTSDLTSLALIRLEPRVIVNIITCDKQWCKVLVDDRKGWIMKAGLWGVYPTEAID
jgi:SH3-like domain-containing protein